LKGSHGSNKSVEGKASLDQLNDLRVNVYDPLRWCRGGIRRD